MIKYLISLKSKLFMRRLDEPSFTDCVSGERVYYWRDYDGLCWMAVNSRTFFNLRVRVPRLDKTTNQ